MKYILPEKYEQLCLDALNIRMGVGERPFCSLSPKQTLTSNCKAILVNGALVYLAPGYNRVYKLNILNQLNALFFFILYRIGVDVSKLNSKRDVFLIASLSSMDSAPRQIHEILKKNPKIILAQHGGGFGERITPRKTDLQMLEQGADGFLNWQYGDLKVEQTRFFISFPMFYVNSFKPKVRVVCYGGLGLYSSRNIFPLVECLAEKSMDIVVHLHPNPDLLVDDKVHSKLNMLGVEVERGMSYFNIRKNDVIILDGPFHTIVHYLGYVGYQPLFIWSDLYDQNLSCESKDFFSELRKKKFLIEMDREHCSEVHSRIQRIKETNGGFTKIKKRKKKVFVYEYIKNLLKE